MITAHGGAHGTGRNSKLYKSSITEYECDELEVDARKRRGKLYISNLPALFPGRHLSLEYAVEKVKEYDLFINFDMKERCLTKDVLELAEKMGITDKIFFTGWVIGVEEAKALPGGKVFFNKIPGIPFKEGNAEKIKQVLGDNPRLAGINAGKLLVNEKFLEECVKAGVAVSPYTPQFPAGAGGDSKITMVHSNFKKPTPLMKM